MEAVFIMCMLPLALSLFNLYISGKLYMFRVIVN